MKTFRQRLAELKAELAPQMQDRIIILLNPKDPKPLEAIVAWMTIQPRNVDHIQVNDNATMLDLWSANTPDVSTYTKVLGCTYQQAYNRLYQLTLLNLIYPDGSVDDNASILIKLYINNKINKIRLETQKSKPD